MRLDKNIRPLNYKIELDVDLEKFKFVGREVVKINLGKSTGKIVMNSAELKVKSVGFQGKKVKFDEDKEKELLTIDLGEKVSGEVELSIEFEGKLGDTLAGFYRSKYVDSGTEKYLATTQFEPADARRAFPCFDEPSMKATFDISFVIDKNFTGISNMPVREEKILGQASDPPIHPKGVGERKRNNGKKKVISEENTGLGSSIDFNDDKDKRMGNKKRIVFDTTPVMSTYLVYFGIGEFEFIKGKSAGTSLRVYTTPGKKEQGRFALECAEKFLKYYNDYFGIPYALPKLDQLAIPDFASGAMENWGAITYREIELLFDEKINSAVRKHRVAEVIAHEMAHQWFGNLVTMDWWNDLWLNESFATWMAYKVVDKHFPKWDMWSKFIDDETVGALGLDALKSSHAIKANVKSPGEVTQIFDAISYNKGGSILRMLENYLGEEKFREGLREYMQKHKYGTAETKDLWRALEGVSKEGITGMMDSWINNVGYPVVDVTLKGKSIGLKQKRFLFESNGGGAKWILPVHLKSNAGNQELLMSESYKEVSFDSDLEYVKVNTGHSAFYRVNYPDKLLEKLKDLVCEKKLSNLDRWGVQNDVFALSKAGKVGFDKYLDLIDAYEKEDDYLVCVDIVGNLEGVWLISSGELNARVGGVARKFCKNLLGRLGWDKKKGEFDNYSVLRASVLGFLGRLGDEDVLIEGKKRFDEFLKDPGSLSPDLKGAVFGLVAWDGDESIRKKFVELYKKAENSEDQRKFLSAISGFKDQKVLARTLDYSLSKDVRSQDAYVPIIFAARNPAGREMVWEWVKKNWNKLEKIYGRGGNVKLFETFVRPIGVLTDIEKEKEVNKFFEGKKSRERVEQSLLQSLERLRINHNFMKKNGGL